MAKQYFKSFILPHLCNLENFNVIYTFYFDNLILCIDIFFDKFKYCNKSTKFVILTAIIKTKQYHKNLM
jgi:hypothetical protein